MEMVMVKNNCENGDGSYGDGDGDGDGHIAYPPPPRQLTMVWCVVNRIVMFVVFAREEA